ncbi:MAG: winged helix-turn-helix domain-containing protein [Dokdonella sp.]
MSQTLMESPLPEHAEESREQTDYRYRFGTAEFDEASFELRVAGLREEVERRALEVLACLLRHAGEVVTKDELFSQVWAGRVTVDKVLPNAITKLRRALGEANAELLVTQPRVGYRLTGVIERVALGRKHSSRLELHSGQPVPGRENFILQAHLGGSSHSEVWLAEHAKTRERRVYKFASSDDRLRALKREATLSRVLQESLDERTHFVDLIDWNFENPPFFLECEFGGQSLSEWAQTGLTSTTRDERLELFLQIADAVAVAHGVGVLHKDLKPANVLIAVNGNDRRIRLTDFGSGRLLDPDRLEELGITQFGLAADPASSHDSSTGTPLYVAPEVFSGHVPTVQSDVFALGIMLYQILAGDLGKPMASGWEQDIDDDLLCEDIRLATDGNPSRRLASAAELAQRLRNRDVRREQAQQAHEIREQTRNAHEALARNVARRPYLVALIAALAAGFVVTFALYQTALHARNDARRELDRATAINRFLNEDLIGRSNPLVVAKGQSASLKDVLLGARDRVAKRFASQPLTEASIHTSLATLFNMIELLPESEAEARQALALYEREEGAASTNALNARTLLARLLTRTSKFDESLAQLKILDGLAAGATDTHTTYLVASAWGIYHMNQGDYAKALPDYRTAIPLLRQTEPDNFTRRDSMRMDLINALTQTGKLKEAREEGQSLIDEIATRPDDNGLVVAFAKAAMARTYTLQGDPARAETQLLDAQKTVIKQLGADHTRNLMILSDLFDIAVKRKDWPKALDYAQRVHDGFLAKLGPDHNVTQITAINWGQVLYESGDARDAENRLKPAYEKLTAQLTAQNPQSQIAGFWLAAVAVELGHLDEAAHLLQPLDDTVLEAAGADGQWQLKLSALRGLLLVKRGDQRAAVPMLQSAVDGLDAKAATDGIFYRKAKEALALAKR